MKTPVFSSFILIIFIVIIGLTVYRHFYAKDFAVHYSPTITTHTDIPSLFPKTTAQIAQLTEYTIDQTRKNLAEFLAIPDDKRTFENTIQALDSIGSLSPFAIGGTAIAILEMVHPDKAIRDAAHEAIIRIQQFSVDELSNNKKIYHAFKAYAENNALREQLDEKQWYAINESMKAFKRNGIDLPDEQLEEIKIIQKELGTLTLMFEAAIAQDQSTITVSRNDLDGLPDEFIATLKKDADNNYIVGVDSPTYSRVMELCNVEQTRKKIFHAYNNRAYPANDATLKKIIALRDQLARKLGFESYAHLDLSNEMVQSPERAFEFINDLVKKVEKKADQEFDLLTHDLPPSVSLVDGKLKPWDGSYLFNYYKKKHLAIDEEKIAEYFPLESTIKGLFSIYEKFFSIRFKQLPIDKLWHEEVTLLEVIDQKTNAHLGYFLLDLFPRPNKYSHACHATIIPSVELADSSGNMELSLVIANFPRATGDKPALLNRNYVSTFFHEFGHGLHALLGRTRLASQSGTSVKCDFVEMPSQMLEEWLDEEDILHMVSSHYKTGEPLPHELIQKISALKTFDAGSFVQGQSIYALLSLNLYMPGEEKSPYDIMKKLYTSIKKHSLFYDDLHMYASFGHLTGYGAKYYSYLWSKVFALDLFNYIKTHGLLSPEVGERYKTMVIGQGGSVDPNILLEDFLGRQPNQEAFLKSLGL